MPTSSKILYVVNDSRFFMSHRFGLAQAARHAGFEVEVAVPDDKARTEIEAAGFPVHLYPLSRSGTNILQELASIKALVALYRQVKPQLVHQLTIKPVIYGSIAAMLAKVPCVVNALTGLGYVYVETGIKARIIRAIVNTIGRQILGRGNSMAIFQNPDDRQVFLQYRLVNFENSIVIRSSGVDVQKLQACDDDPSQTPQIIFGGRMLWLKGVAEFVRAARVVKEQGAAARFILVGDTDPGNPAAVPASQLQAWHDEGIVEWWGWRTDMPDIFSHSHIACLPSYREGVPKVLLEAGACGRPIVTTDAPGCKETVIEGENGYLVPIGDHEALAKALLTLIENPELRQTMGQASRRLVEQEFSIEKVAAETLAVYASLQQAQLSKNTITV